MRPRSPQSALEAIRDSIDTFGYRAVPWAMGTEGMTGEWRRRWPSTANKMAALYATAYAP